MTYLSKSDAETGSNPRGLTHRPNGQWTNDLDFVPDWWQPSSVTDETADRILVRAVSLAKQVGRREDRVGNGSDRWVYWNTLTMDDQHEFLMAATDWVYHFDRKALTRRKVPVE